MDSQLDFGGFAGRILTKESSVSLFPFETPIGKANIVRKLLRLQSKRCDDYGNLIGESAGYFGVDCAFKVNGKTEPIFCSNRYA